MKYVPDERIPDLSGKVCITFVAEQSWFKGKLHHPYNAFYLEITGSGWHRFRVDCVGLYWKAVESPNHPLESDMEGWEFRLTPMKDYDVVGRTIDKVDAYKDVVDQQSLDDMQFCNEAGLRIHFVGGSRLEFRYSDDIEIRLVEGS